MGISREAGPMDTGPYSTGVFFKDPAFVKSPFKSLPKDVVLLIFKNLGANDIDSMRLVCKNFKQSADQLLPAVARQLNIPLRQEDAGKDIRAFFILREKASFADCYEIIPGNPPAIQGRQIIEPEDIAQLQNLINKFKDRYPDHPYIKLFDERVLVVPKFPECTNFINIARSAMEHLPPGSWTSYMGHYVYKAPDSKITHYDTNNFTDRGNAPDWLRTITQDESKKVEYRPFAEPPQRCLGGLNEQIPLEDD